MLLRDVVSDFLSQRLFPVLGFVADFLAIYNDGCGSVVRICNVVSGVIYVVDLVSLEFFVTESRWCFHTCFGDAKTPIIVGDDYL